MKYFLFTAFFSLFIINCNSEQNEVQDVITDDVLNCVPKTWYKDSDGDGFGDPSISVLSCSQPEGYTLIKEEVVVSDDLIFIPGEQKPFLINETNAGYGFYLFTPAEYTETKEKGYPLLIHLHGGGARGQGDAEDTMKGVIYDGPPSLVKNSKWNPPVPMIMATPQSPTIT